MTRSAWPGTFGPLEDLLRNGRALVATSLGLMLGGLIAFWGFRPVAEAPEAVAPGAGTVTLESRPSETSRGRASWAARAAWVERHPLADPELQGMPVRLDAPLTRPHALDRQTPASPAVAFPAADEAPLPRGEASERLQALLRVEAAGEDAAAAEQAFLAAARRARLDPTASDAAADPWRALVTLEAERRRALGTRRRSPEADAHAAGRWMARLAGHVVERHPGTAAADHAWLYRLAAVGDPAWDTFDPAQAGALALEALRTSSDALVRAIAVEHLAQAPASADLLAGLDAAWLAGTPTPWIAAAGADHAVGLGDVVQASAWLGRLQDAVDLSCEGGPEKITCRAWSHELAWSRAQLHAIEGTEAEGWRDHLQVAAWRCHVWRVPLSVSRLTAHGVWEEGHWVWTWPDGTSDFAGCLEAEAWFGPHPDEAVEIEVVVGL